MSFIRGAEIVGFPFELLDGSGDPITTGTVTGYYLLDGGAQTALTGTATHEGNGQWSWDTIPATATDGELLGLLFVHSLGRASFTIKLSSSPYGELIAGTPSEVEICNLALLSIGAEAIESLTDTTDRAVLCRHFYPSCRDELLTVMQPQAAIKRSLLAGTTTPISGWDYAFTLPTDCLQPLDIDDETVSWAVEGNTIVTNSTPIYLRYVSRLEDVTKYPSTFARTLLAYLSARLTYPITKSATLMEENYRLYELSKEEGMAVEGQTGTPRSMGNSVLTTDVRS